MMMLKLVTSYLGKKITVSCPFLRKLLEKVVKGRDYPPNTKFCCKNVPKKREALTHNLVLGKAQFRNPFRKHFIKKIFLKGPFNEGVRLPETFGWQYFYI